LESFRLLLQQFPHYSESAFEKAIPYISEQTIAPKEYFLREGKVCRNIAFIETGLLRLYYINEGKEVTHCFCKEQTITTSYKSLITQSESDIAIQAIEETKLQVLSYDSLQKLYAEDLFWQQLGRLTAENEYVVSESQKRFINDLTATERYLQFLESDRALFQRIPLNYLASYLQIAPETLSRIRNKIVRT